MIFNKIYADRDGTDKITTGLMFKAPRSNDNASEPPSVSYKDGDGVYDAYTKSATDLAAAKIKLSGIMQQANKDTHKSHIDAALEDLLVATPKQPEVPSSLKSLSPKVLEAAVNATKPDPSSTPKEKEPPLPEQRTSVRGR